MTGEMFAFRKQTERSCSEELFYFTVILYMAAAGKSGIFDLVLLLLCKCYCIIFKEIKDGAKLPPETSAPLCFDETNNTEYLEATQHFFLEITRTKSPQLIVFISFTKERR